LDENTEILQKVLQRSGAASVADLVTRWQQWHVREIQPISDYSLTTHFGRRLYVRDNEKRLCGRFIADAEAYGRETIVHDADHVIVPEGTSAFYVGLAIASRRRNILFITSNGALVREFNENPALAAAASNIAVIGGELDPNIDNGGAASRGFLGKDTEEYFSRAIEFKPGVTVVICSVNGLLPHLGPFAPSTPKAGSTRYALLKKAFHQNVRQVVFVADYSKLLDSRRRDYGDPIFSNPKEWHSIVADNRTRISFVVAGPPELQQVPAVAEKAPADRPTRGLDGPLSTPLCKEYLRTAKELDELSRGSGFASRFFEVGGHVNEVVRSSGQLVATAPR
jgi:hypothetical protein